MKIPKVGDYVKLVDEPITPSDYGYNNVETLDRSFCGKKYKVDEVDSEYSADTFITIISEQGDSFTIIPPEIKYIIGENSLSEKLFEL